MGAGFDNKNEFRATSYVQQFNCFMNKSLELTIISLFVLVIIVVEMKFMMVVWHPLLIITLLIIASISFMMTIITGPIQRNHMQIENQNQFMCLIKHL